jgi:dethiobiotin synthetase
MTAYFVTGTDTGVGKTTVSAGILAALRDRAIRVAALKPAETGCVSGAAQDAQLLRAACGWGDEVPLAAIAPHRYATPVAPAVAARLEHHPFSMERVSAAFASLEARLILVEGAGGLLVPFGDGLFAADVAARLDLPLLIVARASLGTINHTLLTIFEARRRGLKVAGVILNRVLADKAPDEDDNPAEVARLGDVRVLGTVPHIPSAARGNLAALADAVSRAFDPACLL